MTRAERRRAWRARSPARSGTAPRAAAPAAIRVRIEELTLAGFDRAGATGIADALRAELGRLVGAGGVPAGWRAAADRPRVGEARLAPRERPATIGVALARAVYDARARGRR
jgi:hypothetical protein